ncbi:hypothetical protein B0H10DRAFT_1866517, partial [Mycena sp. CBHHK59/15]
CLVLVSCSNRALYSLLCLHHKKLNHVKPLAENAEADCAFAAKLKAQRYDAAYAQLTQPKARRNATASSSRAQSVLIP